MVVIANWVYILVIYSIDFWTNEWPTLNLYLLITFSYSYLFTLYSSLYHHGHITFHPIILAIHISAIATEGTAIIVLGILACMAEKLIATLCYTFISNGYISFFSKVLTQWVSCACISTSKVTSTCAGELNELQWAQIFQESCCFGHIMAQSNTWIRAL